VWRGPNPIATHCSVNHKHNTISMQCTSRTAGQGHTAARNNKSANTLAPCLPSTPSTGAIVLVISAAQA
jgi:hypothetical protein